MLWDFDGTLARRPGGWRAALLTALSRVDPSHRATEDRIRVGLQHGFPWQAPDVEHVEIRSADQWWERVTPVLIHAYEGAGVARSVAVSAVDLVRPVYVDPGLWSVFDDTRRALTLLRNHGWRHIVLSNHVPELPVLVADLGLTDLIDSVITSAVTGYEKPHPAMFRAGLAAAPAAARVVMVGDDPIADVAGAEAAGVPAFLVRDRADHALDWVARRIVADVAGAGE